MMNTLPLIKSFLLLMRQPYTSIARNVYMKQSSQVSRSCWIQNEANYFTSGHIRKYCVNQTDAIKNPKQQKKGTGVKILKYISGFVGACVLTGISLRLYKRLKYKLKGLEPVQNRHYGWKHQAYHYQGYILPSFVAGAIDEINSFEVRKDDIWIVGFPKSGTTWLGEIIFLIENGVDFEKAKSKIEDRFPYFEYFYPGLKVIENTPSPRYMKTHLPFSLLPSDYKEKKPKTFYLARNPKDTLISFHFFLQEFFVQSMWNFTMSLEDYSQLFLDGKVHYGPWWKHVVEGWEKRNDDHVFYITYEDMKIDLHGSIKRIAIFLGKNLSSEEVEAIASHCSFEAMRKNKFVNYCWLKDAGVAKKDAHFIRKGQIGNWKNHLSNDLETKLDSMMAINLESAGIKFKDSPKTD